MYKPAFIHAYKSSKSSLPINVWANAVGRRLPQFRNEEDVYCPIPIHVKIAGSLNDSNGAVRLSVMPTNKEWYSDLTEALCEMTGERAVNVVNYLGTPIQGMTPEQLMAVGECDCVKSNGTPIRLGSVVPPPLHLSTNKQGELKEWWNQMRSPLAEKIAVQLKGMTMAEIAQATLVEGPIQQIIESHLTQNTLHDLEWNKFLKTFGNGNTDSEQMSKKLLDAVRQSLVANETQIRTHHASIGSEAALWKSNKLNGASSYKDDFTLYRDIIEDAMYHPLVGQQMVHSILYGTKEIGRRAKGGQKKKKKKENGKAHPINSYYQTFHFQEHGKLPGHRIAELNRTEGNVGSEYPGDSKRAIDMFNLFSGRAVDASPSTITNLVPIARVAAFLESELIPIECGACDKKKKKKKNVSSRMPELIPIESKLPELIPIDRELPALVPIRGIRHIERHDPVEIPSSAQLNEPIWVDDCPNLTDFL